MNKKIAARVALTAALASVPVVGAATNAYASGTHCVDYWAGTDTTDTDVCIYVNGSGLTINYAEVTASDAGEDPSSDVWFPTTVNCTVQVGWIDWDNAGNGVYDDWSPYYGCSTFKASPGYTFGVYEKVDAGAVCAYMDFPVYNQEIGGTDDCVTVHA